MYIGKVFISSVFREDFKIGFAKEREMIKEVIGAITQLTDIQPDRGDIEPVRGSEQLSLDLVGQSDAMILLLGRCYGGIRESGFSVTHLEYKKAKEIGNIPIFIYIFSDNIHDQHNDKVQAFKKEIEKNDNVVCLYVETDIFKNNEHSNVLEYKNGYKLEKPHKNECKKYLEVFKKAVENDLKKHMNLIVNRLPEHVQRITSKINSDLSYHKYLDKDTLPYIRRSDFVKSYSVEIKGFLDENDLYEKLFNAKSTYSGLIIKGEGGVGKTRLMLELGLMAEKDGWVTLKILKNFTDWKILNSYISMDKKYCFIFDYIEESKSFSNDIANILYGVLPNLKQGNIKIIANARNTYHDDTPINFIEFDIKNTEEENNYLKYVVKNILKYKITDLNKLKEIQEIFKKPSMAVFFLESPLQDEFNFKDIQNANDFIRTRMRLTFMEGKENFKFKDIEDRVFQFIASLPILNDRKKNKANRDIIKNLKRDGWIEHNESSNTYIAKYNDTINDTVLIEYFNDNIIDNDDALEIYEEIFDFSKEYFSDLNEKDCFFNAYRSVDRIANDLKAKNEINYIDVFESYMDDVRKLGKLFAKSSLFNRLDKLKFMYENEMLGLSSKDFTLTLSRVMDDKTLENKEKVHIEEIFNVWKEEEENLKKYSEYHDGSFLISSYYSFFEENIDNTFIDQYAIEYLKNYANSRNFSYVVSPYLTHCQEIDPEVSNKIINWLNTNQSERNSYSYVVQSYLRKGGSLKAIESSFINWLETYKDENILYCNLVQKYFENGGSARAIEPSIVIWFNNNSENDSYSYVVQSYLKNGGSARAIEPSIVIWFNNNSENDSYSYVVQSYLKNGGSPKVVESLIVDWSKNKCENNIYSYVVQAYYRNGGLLKIIESSIIDWIHINKREGVSFSNVVVEYLSMDGDISLIEKPIKYWLDNHKNEDYIGILLSMLPHYFLNQFDKACIDVYFYKLTKQNNKKIIREKYYKEIKNCLFKNPLQISKNKIKHCFIISQYLKLENKDMVLVEKIMHDFSNYILELSEEEIDLDIYTIYNLYLQLDYSDEKIIRIIIKSYEDYLNNITGVDEKDKEKYLRLVGKYLKFESKNININIIEKITNDVSAYIIYIHTQKITLETSNIYDLYLRLENTNDSTIRLISKSYENYLKDINTFEENDVKEYLALTKKYLKLSTLDVETMYHIKDIMNTIEENHTGQYKDIIVIFYTLSNNNVFIDIEKTESILNNNSFFFKYYLKHPDCKKNIEIIDRELKLTFENKSISNTSINKNIKPVISLYLSTTYVNIEGEKLIIDFIHENINHKNMAEIIIIFLISGNDIKSIEKSVKLFIKTDNFKSHLLRKMENYTSYDNFSNLVPLKEFISQ